MDTLLRKANPVWTTRKIMILEDHRDEQQDPGEHQSKNENEGIVDKFRCEVTGGQIMDRIILNVNSKYRWRFREIVKSSRSLF